MDQEWMYVGNRVSQRFIEWLETFLETNAEYKKPENMYVWQCGSGHVLYIDNIVWHYGFGHVLFICLAMI
jgi:hypothetical protein